MMRLGEPEIAVASSCTTLTDPGRVGRRSTTLATSSNWRKKLPVISLNGLPSAQSQDIGNAGRANVGASLSCSALDCQWQSVDARSAALRIAIARYVATASE